MNALRLRTTMLSPTVIPAVAVGFCAAIFAWYPVCDGDIFWHLAAGRFIAASHGVPHVDPFAFTSDNYRWIDLHWLYQLAMFGMHSLAGMKGILIANSLLFGAAAAIAFSAVSARPALWLGACVWIAALHEVRYLVPHRPIAVSLLCIALFLFCLERFSRSGRARYLAALLPLQIAWVNSQGLFLLGPAVFIAYCAGEAAGRGIEKLHGGAGRASPGFSRGRFAAVALTGCALMAISIVNPYGFEAFSLAAKLFGRIDPSSHNLYAVTIAENTPLAWMLGTPQARYVYGVAILSWLALTLGALQPRTVRFSYLFVSLLMLMLAFHAQRNIILYYFAVLPLIGSLLPGACKLIRENLGKTARPFGVAAMGIAAVMALLSVWNHAGVLYDARGAGAMAPFSFPRSSIAHLRANPAQGAVFNADRYGGYLLWNLYPSRKVFTDTRYAIRPPSFLADYLALLDNPGLFEAVRKKYNIVAVLVPTALVGRYFALARALYENPGWRLVYADGAEALFIRDSAAATTGLSLESAAVVDSLQSSVAQRWRNHPALKREALLHLGWFLLRMGFPDGAERIPGDSLLTETVLLRAECRHARGRSAEAIHLLDAYLVKDPRSVAARLASARIHFEAGESQQAFDAASAVLTFDPWNRKAREIMSRARQKNP